MKQKPMVRVSVFRCKICSVDSLKFVIEEAMTSQKRDDVIAFFYALRNFFRQKYHRPPKSEHARTSMSPEW